MMSGGVHDIEKLRMIAGEIESIHALRARQRFVQMEGDDTSVALVRFCDGTTGVLVESFMMMSLPTAAGAEVHTLRIDGDLGSLVVPDATTIRIYTERPGMWPGKGTAQHDLHIPPADTFALEIEHFANAIRHHEEPLTSGRLQRRPLEVVLAAYDSMRAGHPVKVPCSPSPNPSALSASLR
jgi:predicted dehydrogenase